MSRLVVLDAADLPAANGNELGALFEVLALPADPAAVPAFLAEHGPRIRGMALRGVKVDAAFLAALPALEVISSYSAGLDNLDVDAARTRGIAIENTSHVLAGDVADLAVGLALAVTRRIVQADGWLRGGGWTGDAQFPLTRSISGMTVGIVGLGSIGQEVARRLEVLGARVAYTSRSRKPLDYDHHPDALSLARACDILVLTCPLTLETRHLVDAAVLEALGPRGYLVNVARGPVVDETALIAALARDALAGAALDVFEREPQVPPALIRDPRVVLTPHIGSGTEETRRRMAENVVDALARHFGVPGPRG